MVWEYLQKYYIPAMKRSEKYSQEDYKGLYGFTKWKNRIVRLWPNIQLNIMNGSGMDEDRRILSAGEEREIKLAVHSAGLDQKDIKVEIVLERQDAYRGHQSMKIIPMGMVAKKANDILEYQAKVIAESDGSYRFNCRVMPAHQDHYNQHESRIIKWLD
jgi:starch phosphorylase